MAHDIDDAGMIRRERDVRAAHHFGKRLRIASADRYLHRCRFSAARAAENDTCAIARPAHEVPGHANVRQPTRVAAINIHDPDLKPTALVRLVGDKCSVRGVERVHIHAGVRCQTPQSSDGDLYLPDVWATRTGREESYPFLIRRPIGLEIAPMSVGQLPRV